MENWLILCALKTQYVHTHYAWTKAQKERTTAPVFDVAYYSQLVPLGELAHRSERDPVSDYFFGVMEPLQLQLQVSRRGIT